MSKRAQGLSLNLIIIGAFALVVLVILVVVFIKRDVERSYENEYSIADFGMDSWYEGWDAGCVSGCELTVLKQSKSEQFDLSAREYLQDYNIIEWCLRACNPEDGIDVEWVVI